MTKTAKQFITEQLIIFGRKFQLPDPTAEYIDAIYNALHEERKTWTLRKFAKVLYCLSKDEKYAESARFGKYPMIFDFFRIKKQLDSRLFYESLSSYLAGNWWEKDNIFALATPAQSNAILLAGGLDKLYERANGEMATPIYKLVDIVIQNETESPTEYIDIDHRISAPQTMERMITDLKNKQNSLQQKTNGGQNANDARLSID